MSWAPEILGVDPRPDRRLLRRVPGYQYPPAQLGLLGHLYIDVVVDSRDIKPGGESLEAFVKLDGSELEEVHERLEADAVYVAPAKPDGVVHGLELLAIAVHLGVIGA